MMKFEVDLNQLVTAEDKAAAQKAARTADEQARARVYLAETDWFVTRFAETGKPIPEDIVTARVAARKLL